MVDPKTFWLQCSSGGQLHALCQGHPSCMYLSGLGTQGFLQAAQGHSACWVVRKYRIINSWEGEMSNIYAPFLIYQENPSESMCIVSQRSPSARAHRGSETLYYPSFLLASLSHPPLQGSGNHFPSKFPDSKSLSWHLLVSKPKQDAYVNLFGLC